MLLTRNMYVRNYETIIQQYITDLRSRVPDKRHTSPLLLNMGFQKALTALLAIELLFVVVGIRTYFPVLNLLQHSL